MTLFELDLYINIRTGKAQFSDTSQSRFVLPAFYQGDTVPFKVHLIKPNPEGDFNSFIRPPIDNLTLKCAVSDQPIGTASTPVQIANQFTWNKDVDQDIFDAVLDLSGSAVDTFLGSSSEKKAWIEFEVTDSETGGTWTVFQESFILKAQIIEAASSAVPASETPLSLEMARGLFVPYRLPPGRKITFVDTNENWHCIIGTNLNGDFVSDRLAV